VCLAFPPSLTREWRYDDLAMNWRLFLRKARG
jgi:hypothetical protein